MLGPLIALTVIGVLTGVLRWIYFRDAQRPSPTIPRRDDYGLLCAAAITNDPRSADSTRSRLIAAGIRATVTTGADGLIRVLVFERELPRARRLVG
jgi:hypothetical protein